jgi:hypothetical protein
LDEDDERGHVKYQRKKVGDEIYVHIFNKSNLKNKETETKHGTRELIPKIDHKTISTKGSKERYSKNKRINK